MFSSIVNIILAVEVMWVHLLVIDSLYLDCGVEKSILAAAQVSNSSQSL
jgi:hypothetical protein